jgi:hypothetical protein
MRRHLAAKLPRQHLGAETDAEERLALLERNRDPFDLAAHEIICIIGAHRAAENDGAAMGRKRLGQRIAEAGTADVEQHAALGQAVPDPPRRRALVVQHDQAGRGHR